MHAGQFMWKFLCILTAVSSPRQLYGLAVVYCFVPCAELCVRVAHTGWRTKCHTIDCIHNIFLLLQKHLTYGTELILIGWKIVPNEERVQCDHRFTSQPLANEPLHS